MAQFVQIKEAVADHMRSTHRLVARFSVTARLLRLSRVLGISSAPGLEPGKGHMTRIGGQVRGNATERLPQSAEQNNAAALQRVLESNGDELLWLAEVMAGSRQVGEQCLAEAIELAEVAQYVGQEWILPWVKRLLVHVVLKRTSGEIRELLPLARPGIAVTLARAGVSAHDKQRLRSIPPQRIISSFDVLERACFILYVYLEYPVLDCALLLGSPRSWIESVCQRVLTKMAAVDQWRQNDRRDLQSYGSPEVRECGLKVLSVGLSEFATLVRDALLLRAHSKLAVVTNYGDLCSVSLQREEFQVAVLNEPNSARELRRRARYIRRTWPDAGILLVGGCSEALRDRLFDERVPSNIGPGDFLTVIDRLNPGVGESRPHRARVRCQR